MKIRNLVAVMALVAAAAALPAAAQSCLDLSTAPPDPRVEDPPPSPGESYVWSPGYWDCQDRQYAWVDGGWILDQPGYIWEPHHWEDGGNDRWHLHRGGWHPGGQGGGRERAAHEGGGHGR